ncbi:MAG TPA: hypothetical protein ENI18_04055 [Candidatus Aminicenantes bacterium]|nr:hypothetical protein [Candidatus Aminicenantes bacterium]
MKAKEITSAFFILFLSIGLSIWAGEEKLQKKALEKGGEKSLIRKDLLVREKIELGNPVRNIFTLRRSVSRKIERNPVKLRQNQQQNPTLPGKYEASSSLPLNVRYIGYVISDDKMVALIVFEGDALAVEKGEVISEGVKIGKITPEEIEIIGSDSQKRRYYLEGER